jgi:hypothetical protein
LLTSLSVPESWQHAALRLTLISDRGSAFASRIESHLHM